MGLFLRIVNCFDIVQVVEEVSDSSLESEDEDEA